MVKIPFNKRTRRQEDIRKISYFETIKDIEKERNKWNRRHIEQRVTNNAQKTKTVTKRYES